jgi:diguanylate cyclase (GGDEF)-like protein
MKFDVATILFVEVLCALASLLSLAVSSRTTSGAGMREATGASTFLVVAFGLLLLRGRIPDALTVVVPNALLWTGCALIQFTYRAFAGSNTPRWTPAFVGVAVVVFAIAFALGAPYGLRALLTSVAIAVLLSAAAWELVRAGGLQKERSRLLAVGLLGLVVSAMLVRIVVLVPMLHDDGNLFTSSIEATLGFLPGVLVTQGFGMSFLLMHHERSAAQARALATTDALTGCLNRRALEERAALELSWAARSGQPCSLVIVDLDHFKKINDTWGHHAGDVVLQRAAAVVRGCVRPTDVVARVGGEEFCVLLRATPLEGARAVADRVCTSLRQAIVDVDGSVVPVRASLGVAAAAIDRGATAAAVVEPWSALFRRADAALYRAKQGGRDRVELAEAATA